RLDRGRRSPRHRRATRLEASERCRRAGKNRRRDRRQKSRQGGGRESQREGDRLVCRPGDEGVRGHSQSANRQRTSPKTHRRLNGKETATAGEGKGGARIGSAMQEKKNGTPRR